VWRHIVITVKYVGLDIVGKASKLLTICVTADYMLEWPEVQKLQAQGHTIIQRDSGDIDGYLGPDCWMMDTDLRAYIPLAVRAMRERKYGGKGVQHGVQDQGVVKEGGGEAVDAGTDGGDTAGEGDQEAEGC